MNPVAVAVSASTVARSTGGYARGELARVCAGEPWATRVMLRLWRDVAASARPYWPPVAAVAYSRNDRHDGRSYRFHGVDVGDRPGQFERGGAWSRRRSAGDDAYGAKALWLRRFDRRPG